MSKVSSMTIDKKKIGKDHLVYFIADIAANHDGDIEKFLENHIKHFLRELHNE